LAKARDRAKAQKLSLAGINLPGLNPSSAG